MKSKVKESSASPTTANGISTQNSPCLNTFVVSTSETPHKFSNPIDIISKKSSIKSFGSVKFINTLEITSPLLNTDDKYVNRQSDHCTSEFEDSKKAGLSCLPDQCEKSSNLMGGKFSLMVAGSRGTGKSSFVNCLFGSELLVDSYDTTNEEFLDVKNFELTENGFTLNLQVIETVNYGNSFDTGFKPESLCAFVDEKFKAFLYQSKQPRREGLIDLRVHCCVYFLFQTVNPISDLDIQTMKSLSTRTNLIPVVAKADTLTETELHNFEIMVRTTLAKHDIETCQFFSNKELLQEIRLKIPFSIISSSFSPSLDNNNGIIERIRKYPWCLLDIENESYCDFHYIRKLLLEENMLEFVASTEVYYEQFRSIFLSGDSIAVSADYYKNYGSNQSKNLKDKLDRKNSNMKENFNYYQDQHDKLKAKKLYLIQQQKKLQNEIHSLANERTELQVFVNNYETSSFESQDSQNAITGNGYNLFCQQNTLVNSLSVEMSSSSDTFISQ